MQLHSILSTKKLGGKELSSMPKKSKFPGNIVPPHQDWNIQYQLNQGLTNRLPLNFIQLYLSNFFLFPYPRKKVGKEYTNPT